MESYLLGLLVAVALMLVLAVIAGATLGKNQEVFGGFSEKEFDERQQRARVKAFKAGFYTMLCYNAIYAVSSGMLSRPWCDVPTGCFLGICLGMTVFAVTCIMNDAYFTPKNNPRKVMALFVFVMLMNAVPAVINIVEGLRGGEGMITDGALNFRCLNLAMTLMLLVLFITLIIKRAIDRRGEDE